MSFRQLEAIRHWDEGEETVEIKGRPWVTQWDSKVLSQVREEFHPRGLGYRFLEHRPEMRTDIYARPLVVWAYLWCCLRVRGIFWGVVDWLGYKHGFIHFTTPDGQRSRWRDLRLGPGGRR